MARFVRDVRLLVRRLAMQLPFRPRVTCSVVSQPVLGDDWDVG